LLYKTPSSYFTSFASQVRTTTEWPHPKFGLFIRKLLVCFIVWAMSPNLLFLLCGQCPLNCVQDPQFSSGYNVPSTEDNVTWGQCHLFWGQCHLFWGQCHLILVTLLFNPNSWSVLYSTILRHFTTSHAWLHIIAHDFI